MTQPGARPSTLTRRVVMALVGIVAVFVALLALLAYLTFDQMEDDLVNDILATETGRVLAQIHSGDAPFPAGAPRELGASMRAWLVADAAGAQSLPPPLRGLGTGLHLLEPGPEVWHVNVVDAPAGRLYVLYDATDNEARVTEFGLIVLGLGLACVVASYVLARKVAGLAVAPMLELTDRLSNWAPGSPDFAVQRDDEAGRLIEAFNRVQNQVDRSIAREREFSANLSHEIRTPLAALRSDAEIMLLDAGLKPDTALRLRRMVREVDSVVAAMQSVRSLASERPGERVDVALAECLDDAWRGYRAQAEQAGLRLVNALAPDERRMLDPYALLMVLRNLIRNAVEHAAPATLTVSAFQGGLLLADDGIGIAAADLPFVFDRYYRGRLDDTPAEAPDGLATARGLGLAIAKRVCDMQGWRLSVESETAGPRRGTRFLLQFEAA